MPSGLVLRNLDDDLHIKGGSCSHSSIEEEENLRSTFTGSASLSAEEDFQCTQATGAGLPGYSGPGFSLYPKRGLSQVWVGPSFFNQPLPPSSRKRNERGS
ncbi:hypothetical protein NPIL_588411 [Nephila pilipes]|uniref:Uncharacterized protein n=1 Tax=Nephila pilipes TaxID=299642 RepID=A0A8X6PJM6_NEPPI|nr:hypothetical protein NPIL_588411 [Nephila pilipes]